MPRVVLGEGHSLYHRPNGSVRCNAHVLMAVIRPPVIGISLSFIWETIGFVHRGNDRGYPVTGIRCVSRGGVVNPERPPTCDDYSKSGPQLTETITLKLRLTTSARCV